MEHIYSPKGDIVYEEGQYGDFFYILLLGEVSVYISDQSQKYFLSGGVKKFEKFQEDCYQYANSVLNSKYEFTRLKPGDAFGENALLRNKSYGESLLCTTSCHFARLSKAKFEEILKSIEFKTKSGWTKFFKSNEIFQKLTLSSLEKLFYLLGKRYHITL